MEPVERQAVRLMVYRMVVVLTFFLSALGIQVFLGSESGLQPFFYLIALVLAQNLLYTLLYNLARGLRGRPLLIYIQLAGDVFAVSLLSFFTGGVNSIFTLLYPVLVVVGGYLLRRRGAWIVAIIDALGYGLFCVALFYDWVNPERMGGSYPYEAPTAGATLYALLAHYVGFALVAALMTTLSQRFESTRAALGVMERDFSSLRNLNEQLVSSLSFGVVTMDPWGKVTFANPAAMRLLGETLPAGWNFESKLSVLGRQEGRGDADETAEREFDVVLPDNRCLNVVLAPLRTEGQTLGRLALIRDQTEVVRLREQLALKDRLMAIGAMAADIAHEIKNPLGSISGAAQMLGRHTPGAQDERALLKIIQEESRRLSEVLSNFLRYVSPATPKRRRTDLASLTEEVIALFRNDPACGAGLAIGLSLTEAKVMLSVDPDQVRQALWNLVLNARKAVGGKGRIAVSLTATGEEAILAVEDDGVGMDPAQIAEFFQPFRRGFSEGSGLGLSVVYRIMEQHGGRIDIDSAPGRGTRCRLTFPLEAANG